MSVTEQDLAEMVEWWQKAGYKFDRSPQNVLDLFALVERQHQELVASGYSRAHHAPDDPRFAVADEVGSFKSITRSRRRKPKANCPACHGKGWFWGGERGEKQEDCSCDY
jgi:hypothetical protein